MAIDTTKINNEAISVIYKTVDLGLIEPGGATVTWNMEWVKRKGNQTGNATIEAFDKGVDLEITVAFSEVDNWSLWAAAFQATGEVQTFSAASRFAGHDNATSAVQIVGQKASAFAGILVLRPLRSGSLTTEYAHDLTFPKAWCMNVGDIQFDVDAPETLELTFGVLYDSTATDGEQQWFRGLSTGTWV